MLTHRNGWRHVRHAYRALELSQNLLPVAHHLSVAQSIFANLLQQKDSANTAHTNVQGPSLAWL
jgi:hypothetical protein